MAMAGLLWYDDDNRRPLMAKILEAVARYSERVGRAPTVCQLPPQQMIALTEAITHRSKRARKPMLELPRNLRLESDEHLQTNYFILGMGEDDIVLPNPLLDTDDTRNAPRKAPRKLRAPQVAETLAAKAPQVRVSRKSTSTATAAPKPATEATTPKRSTRAKAPAAKPARNTTPAQAPQITQVALFADEPAAQTTAGEAAKRTRKPRVVTTTAQVQAPPTRGDAHKVPALKSPVPSKKTRKTLGKKAAIVTSVAARKTAKAHPPAQTSKAPTLARATAPEPKAVKKSPARTTAQTTEITRVRNTKTRPIKSTPSIRPAKKTGETAKSAKSTRAGVHEQVVEQIAPRRRAKTLAKSA